IIKKSIILSWALSIIALTLVSCTSTSGTNTTTTGQTTAQTAGRAPAMPPPTQSSMGAARFLRHRAALLAHAAVGRQWYDTPDHAIGYAMHSSRSQML